MASMSHRLTLLGVSFVLAVMFCADSGFASTSCRSVSGQDCSGGEVFDDGQWGSGIGGR